MTEHCLDIGTIQAFLDGELASERLEAVSRHIALCDNCAILLAEAEEETAFAFTALDAEFNGFIPTNRLWTKINDSIEQQKKPFWQTIFARFVNPTVAAFASLVIVAGFFAAMLTVKTDDNKNFAAINNLTKQAATSPISQAKPIQSSPVESKVNESESSESYLQTASPEINKNKINVVKASFSTNETVQRPISKQPSAVINRNPPPINADSRPANAAVLGEESYVKTIATLEKTVDSRKDEVLKPSARFAFERDLAVTDDAITKMKAEVKKNPKNDAAKDVLRASYQNKIDLLNSVAEKTELMASLK